MLEKFPESNECKTGPGSYSLINNDILIRFGKHGGVHLNVTDLDVSEKYYNKIGLVSIEGEYNEEKYLQFKGYDYFTLVLSKANAINRGEAFGRMAFSCANADIERVFKDSGSAIINPPVTLPTEGKADVIVTILASPDAQEICFVNDIAFRELSKETGEQVDWERYERLTKEQGAYVPEKKENLAWDADL